MINDVSRWFMMVIDGYWWLLLVVKVNAFQWNVRPRLGIFFRKSVRCCVQVVFIMFMFSPIHCLSWVFHGYHADDCSYSLVMWAFYLSPIFATMEVLHHCMVSRCPWQFYITAWWCSPNHVSICSPLCCGKIGANRENVQKTRWKKHKRRQVMGIG